MKQLDIRFVKERDNKKLEYQMALVERLQQVLPQRIAEKFSDVNVRIRFSSSSGADISGFRDSDEKQRFTEYLEELWMDDSILEM
ncbi:MULTISPECIES: DinI-like family protein [unclassified Lonepinella]|uniref:DinI-like family protein n=1 Tax=unclassified Lonepinella TaxID=2642006 RepID=UPI003F6DD462